VETVIDGSLIAVCGPKLDTFLIFVYKAVADNLALRDQRYYAVDFGVKRHADVCHISLFDAISEVYQAILAVLDSNLSLKNGT
jgi:hypothetical protein